MLSRTKNRDFGLRQNKFELARTKFGDFGPDHNQNKHPNLEGRADGGVPSRLPVEMRVTKEMPDQVGHDGVIRVGQFVPTEKSR